MMRSRIAVIVLLVMSVVPGLALTQEVPVVTGIEVRGLKRIEEGAIRAKVSQKTGEPLSQQKTTEDIRTLYKMGYFDDVKVEIEPFEGGIKVIYLVTEKPTVLKVEFQGNKKFEDSKLKEVVALNPGAIADITLINDNAAKLRGFYEDEGFYLAKVVPVVRRLTPSEVAVTFQIEEGLRVKIKSIRIEGNSAISEKKIKKPMKTTERGWLSFITGTGYYKKDVMRADIERIKDVYYNNGYLKVTVSDPKLQLTDDKQGMKITIQVSEGEQFRVSSVDISGVKSFPEAAVSNLIKLAPKGVFSKETLQKDVVAITDYYSNSGYALVTVSPDIAPHEEKKVAKVLYRIEEGDKYRIGRVDISGNTKTRDKVIRREVRLDEGDVFNAAALKRSYERINNLQYFETVDLSPKPRPEEKLVDIDIKVKEKSTGFVSIGGGYSSVDQLIGMVDITQSNLFGQGRYVKVRAELGGLSSFYELSYRDPWFMDRPLNFGLSIYNTTREYPVYDRESQGIELSLGKSFWEYWGGTVAYNLEKTDISNIDDDATSVIREQEGTAVTSSVSTSVVRDTRDNYMDPSRGTRSAVYLTFAGLGGDNKFFKSYVDFSRFFPFYGGTTFHVRARAGYATGLFGEDLPLYERFYVGGIYTVRGLEYGDAGPKDEDGEPIGGLTELIFNFEYIFPILPEVKLKGVVFSDVGRAYDTDETFGSDLRYTAGAGIRWISPMGPIRVEWGYNFDKRQGEPQSKVEFTFGSFF